MKAFQFVLLQDVVTDIIESRIAASIRREMAYRTIERSRGCSKPKKVLFSDYRHVLIFAPQAVRSVVPHSEDASGALN